MKKLVNKMTSLNMKQLFLNLKTIVFDFFYFIRFFLLMAIILTFSVFIKICRIFAFIRPFKIAAETLNTISRRVTKILEPAVKNEIKSHDLILLAISHLSAKKARSFVTVGGMAIGFGAIIFLLSIGYGFERLVISQVTNLEELKQIDIATSQSSALSFNDETLEQIQYIEAVDEIMPVIASVSKVNYNNSLSDAVSFGVTSKYLQQSATQPIRGNIFEDEKLVIEPCDEDCISAEQADDLGQIAGATIEMSGRIAIGREKSKIRYSIYPLIWKPVYESPSKESPVIGLTRRVIGEQEATEVWGKAYHGAENYQLAEDGRGNKFVPWIKDSFALWDRPDCIREDLSCDTEPSLLKQGAHQKITTGFITQDEVVVERYEIQYLSKPVFDEGRVFDEVQLVSANTEWVQLFSEPQLNNALRNQYTKIDADTPIIYGRLLVGGSYSGLHGAIGENSNGRKVGYWIKADLPLWKKIDCGDDCGDYFLAERNQNQEIEYVTAYVKAGDFSIDPLPSFHLLGQVLGEATELDDSSQQIDLEQQTDAENADDAVEQSTVNQVEATDSASLQTMMESAFLDLENIEDLDQIQALLGFEDDDLDWVMIASQAASLQQPSKEIIPFSENSRRTALVNLAMLNVLGINTDEAMGQKFNASFVFDSRLFDKVDSTIETESSEFTIVGIMPDDKTPTFYLPFNDLKNTGVKNYSQVRIIVNDEDKIEQVRKEVESLGFRTTSIIDTIERINALFINLRLGLLVFGLVALGVACLGMFNTLTVSLLEKTREVGLMKAVGMQSKEVKRLFLAESVIMGFSGGFFGLLLGYLGGRLLSLGLSYYSISQGFDPIDVAFIPPRIIVVVIISSLAIGLMTGFYPAYRATKISALNALRYE